MKKKKTISMVIMFIMISIVIGCGSAEVKTKEAVPAQTNITSLLVEPYGVNRFILRYSNIIYEDEGKKFKLPIFQGTFGDVLYDDYLNYCWDYELMNKSYVENGFIIKCRRGDVKKTFHNLLAFYKSNILKDVDIEKPVIEYPYGDCLLVYDFKMNGITSCIFIQFKLPYEHNYTQSVYDIKPNEDVLDPHIMYNFFIGRSGKGN